MANGGRKPQDFQQRTGGPGRFSARTDLSGNQPVRVPTGLPYGEAGKMRALQQTIALPESGGPGPAMPPTPNGGGLAPAPPVDPAMAKDVLRAVSDSPMERSKRQVTAETAALALENLIASTPGGVSATLMGYLMELKRESLRAPRSQLAELDLDDRVEDEMENFGLDGLMDEVADLDQEPLVVDADMTAGVQPPEMSGAVPESAPANPPVAQAQQTAAAPPLAGTE